MITPDLSPTPPSPSLDFSTRDLADFIDRARRDFDSLPLPQRAAFNSIAAHLLAPFDADAAQLARSTAAFLREADAHQARLFDAIHAL